MPDRRPHKRAGGLLLVLLLVLLQASNAFFSFFSPSNRQRPWTTVRRPPGLESSQVGSTRLWSSRSSSSQPPKRLTVTEQLKLSPNRWKRNGQPLQPGVGGIWPGKPDAKTYKVTVRDPRTGANYTMDVPEDRYIYFAFEDAGIDLPMINGRRMCRNGACTTCAVKLDEGNVKMEAALGLLRDMKKRGFALSCCSLPLSDIVCTMQDEDEVYLKQWGETFEGGGVEWGGFLPEDD